MSRFVFSVLAVAGCVAASERDHCPPSGTPAEAPGQIVEGRAVAAGALPVFPYKVAVAVRPERPLTSVAIDKLPMALVNNTQQQQRWELLLTAADFEGLREGDQAHIEVIATDDCGNTATVDETDLPIGPGSVEQLDLVPELPVGECGVPSDGSASALLRVTATKASAGAKVTVRASQGVLSGGTATQELTLVAADTRSEATTFFTSNAPGRAVLTASATGVPAAPKTVTSLGPPVVAGPTAALRRGTTYTVTFRSDGNLDRCQLDEVVTGAAVVTLLEPNLGQLTGERSVRVDAACATPERVQIAVAFGAGTPDGASVTLRCFDTFGRAAFQTLTVESTPPP